MHRALHLCPGWRAASASPVQHTELRVPEQGNPGHADVIRSWVCVAPLRCSHAAFIKQNHASQNCADCTGSASRCRPEALANWERQLGAGSPSLREYPTASMCPASVWHCRMTVVTLRNAQHCKECQATAELGASFQLLEIYMAQWECSWMGMDQNVLCVRKPLSTGLLLKECIQILTNPCGVV